MNHYLVLLLAITISLPLSASAQQEPGQQGKMQVDLPDETEETDVLEKRQIQLETGVLYNRYRHEEPSLIGIGMLRYGLTDKVELRLLAEDGRNRDVYLEETVQSTSPFALGTKVSLLQDRRVLPDITAVAYLKIPLTSRSKEQAIYCSPIFLLAFKNELSDDWVLEYNAGLQQEAFGPRWFWLGNVSLHYEIRENLEVFLEYFAQYQRQEEPVHNAGGGIAWQAGPNWEFFLSRGQHATVPGCQLLRNDRPGLPPVTKHFILNPTNATMTSLHHVIPDQKTGWKTGARARTLQFGNGRNEPVPYCGQAPDGH